MPKSNVISNIFEATNIEHLSTCLSSFYEFTGYSIEIYDNNGEQQIIYIGTNLCKECHFRIPELRKLHLKNIKQFTSKCIKQNKILITNCHGNYYRAYAPVKYAGNAIGVLIIGPVIQRNKNTENSTATNKQKYSQLTKHLPEYSYEKLYNATSHILNLINKQITNHQQTHKLISEINKNRELQVELEEQNQKLIEYNDRLTNLFTKLQENRTYYKTVFETTGSSTMIINKEGIITDVNNEGIRMWGYSKEEIVGRHWTIFIDKSEVSRLKENWELRIAGKKKPYDSYTTKIVAKSGQSRNVLLYSRTIKDSQQLVISLVDIHEYIETQKQLYEKKQQYKILTNSINDCIFVLDKQGRYKYLNYAFEKITGYKREDFIGKHFTTKVVPKYQEPLVNSFKKSLTINETKYHRIEFYNADNKIVPVEINVSNLLDENGNVTGRIGVFRDISKQLEYENKINETKQLYKAIVENIHDAIYIYQDNKVVFINQNITKTLGFTYDDLTSKNIINVFASKDEGQKMLHNARKRLIGDNVPSQFIVNLKTKDKQIKPCLFSVKIIDYNGKKAILGVIRDLSQEKEREKEIHKLYSAIQNSPQPIIIAGKNGIIEYVNKSVLKTLQFKNADDIINKKYTFFAISRKERQRLKETIIPHIQKNGFWKGEITLTRKDESEFPAFVIYSTFKNENHTENIIIHFNDISEQKRIEKEIIEAKEKAEESNRLKSAFMANMNHEIRTPMNAILGFSNLMLDSDNEQKERFAKIINTSAQQLMSLINDIIELSHLQSEKNIEISKTKVQLSDIINDVISMVEISKQNNIPIIKNLPGNINNLTIETNPQKLKQVLSNLLSNAIKYTKEGFVELGVNVQKKHIELYVKDTGIGIPEKDLKNIFNTFYRAENATKEAIRGTGLGLSIVKQICNILDIDINAESELNKGSVFKLKLNCEFDNNYKQNPILTNEHINSNKQTYSILIAEDELSNYLFLETILKKYAKKIDRAINGKEAVKLALKNQYDIILMDIKMPELDGISAGQLIRDTGNSTPIIAQSAFASEAKVKEAQKAGINDYITKPIDPNELIIKIRKWTNKKTTPLNTNK